MTASQATAPDNLMGWGIIDALAAMSYLSRGAQFPRSFILGDSYPNPFPTPANPSTTIGFILAEQSEVTLKIFNTLGQEVRTVINDHRTSGAFRVEWDGKNSSGTNVASGVYFYTITAQGRSGITFTETKKLIMLK
jgi:flagellar hook assembly protein FlgD